MTETQAKPRRRRRWLIVAVVVLLLASVAWWYYPRGDARFVGKWEFRNGSGGVPNQIMAFQSNGLAHVLEKGVSETLWFRWRIDQGELVIGSGGTGTVVDAIQRLSKVIGNVTSHQFVYGDKEYRFIVLSIAKEEITLGRPDSEDKIVLYRIPE